MTNTEKVHNRTEIADIIVGSLLRDKQSLTDRYAATSSEIGYFCVDNLLDEALARRIYHAFPEKTDMVPKKSLRERKYIAAQMDRYDPLLEETLFAFQDPRVVTLVSAICALPELYPDEHLYAGGISMMGHGDFLNPHIDNSHDNYRQTWRVLNLLFYVTPEWDANYGGNLELWPRGIGEEQTTIHSVFNRLVVMTTHQQSWHSVSQVTGNTNRCCVSNYFFSPQPIRATDRFHVTSFRGRPEEKFKDLVLQADAGLRMALRRIRRQGLAQTAHIYRK